MRIALVNALIVAAAKDRRIVLLTGDLGYNALEPFRDRFPDRFLNLGVAEQNMVGFAAGLALTGRIPIIYSIATFATLKTAEQIRTDICYQGLNAKIVGVGAGLTYSQYGATHQATEDIALMRSLPRMNVLCPGDPAEVTAAVHTMFQTQTPCYLRIGASGEQTIHRKSCRIRLGKGITLRRGPVAALIATGTALPNAIAAADALAAAGTRITVVSMPTVKPIDVSLVKRLAATLPALITVEEHSLIGGLGSAVAEVIAALPQPRARLTRIALPDAFQKTAGWLDYLRAQNRLSPQAIARTIRQTLRRT